MNIESVNKRGKQEDKQPIRVFQFNKIKGNKEGSFSISHWNQDRSQFQCEDQMLEQTNKLTYKAAIVDSQTGNIVEWRNVELFQAKSTLKEQEASGYTTQQPWNIQYKKKLAEEFGTNKSRRKVNQMLSNTINP